MQRNLAHTRAIAAIYDARLNPISLSKPRDVSASAYWLYTIRVPNRKEFVGFMAARNIVVSHVHNRNDTHTCFAPFKAPLPGLDSFDDSRACIPIGWWISHETALDICMYVREWVHSHYSFRALENTPQDFGAYTALLAEVNSARTTYDVYQKKFSGFNNAHSRVYLLCDDRGAAVGTGKVWVEAKLFDSVMHVEDIIVVPPFRKFGLARFMVDQLIRIGRDFEVYKIVLECKSSLAPLYEQCGFVSEGYEMCFRYNGQSV